MLFLFELPFSRRFLFFFNFFKPRFSFFSSLDFIGRLVFTGYGDAHKSSANSQMVGYQRLILSPRVIRTLSSVKKREFIRAFRYEVSFFRRFGEVMGFRAGISRLIFFSQ